MVKTAGNGQAKTARSDKERRKNSQKSRIDTNGSCGSQSSRGSQDMGKAMTEDKGTIRTSSGGLLSFYRSTVDTREQRLVWDEPTTEQLTSAQRKD